MRALTMQQSIIEFISPLDLSIYVPSQSKHIWYDYQFIIIDR